MLLCSLGNFGPKPPFLPYFNILQNTSSEKYFCFILQLHISHRISNQKLQLLVLVFKSGSYRRYGSKVQEGSAYKVQKGFIYKVHFLK